MDTQNKCLECVVFYDLAKLNIPCNGTFPDRCEYNGTAEEEEEEEDGQ